MVARTAVILSISLANLVSCGDIGAGTNRDVHAALCALVLMTGCGVEIPQVPPLPEEDYDIIQTLNFSNSSDSWQSMFYSYDKRTEVHETDTKARQEGKGYTEFWSDWQNAAKKAANLRSDTKNKITSAASMANVPKALAHAKIEGIAADARKLKQQFPDLPAQLAAITAEAATTALNTAIFGSASATTATVTVTNAFGATTGASGGTACTAGSGVPRPNSAAAALACVCLKPSANAAAEVCTAKADGSGTWVHNSGTEPLQTDLTTLLKTCGKSQSTKITFQDIQQAITRLEGLLHTDENDGYLGAFVASGCTGSSGEGMCVKFPG